MASGGEACAIPAHVPVAEAVRNRIGVPESEQRLFRDGKELPFDAVLSDSPLSSPIMLVRSESDPRVTNLSHFHVATNFDKVDTRCFTLVRKISQGINGDVFKYKWRREMQQHCEDVAVKKLRNRSLLRKVDVLTNERSAHLSPGKNAPPDEDALAEIGVLSYLADQPDCSKYLLKMLGCFSDFSHTWLVTELADRGELLSIVSSEPTPDDIKKRYSSELLQGVSYLHEHRIGHRDISLENILIREDTVKLMDFGLAVCTHSASGTPLRYFKTAGKNYYRAPECYVPMDTQVQIVAPSNSESGDIVMVSTDSRYLCEFRLPPDSIPGSRCKADVWGYEVQPADIFATGMVIFIMWTGFPIWSQALLSNPTFAFVHKQQQNGLADVLQRWRKPLPPTDLLNLLVGMLRTDAPCKRLSADECLNSPWFTSLTICSEADT
jgi:serine/threonine protein kinase